jgi:hypothetical protein
MVNSKKPKLMMNGHTDEIYTPSYALNPLLPFLKDGWRIWECALGEGHMAQALKSHPEKKFKVIGSVEDFTSFSKNDNWIGWDCIVSNPPYSKKYEFLKKAYELGKPFAFLMPLTTLEGIKRGALFKKYGLQLIIPNRRINFITPNKGSSSWFATAWFTWGLNLPKDIMFVELNREGQS